MRSFVCALCLALPATGVAAAAPIFANPLHVFHHSDSSQQHHAKPQWVRLTFRNKTLHNIYLQIGNQRFLMHANSQICVSMTVGAVVIRRDESDSRHDGERIMTAAKTDNDRDVDVG